MSGEHRYEPAQDPAGRVRWTCTCGRVGRWGALSPYRSWANRHRPVRQPIAARAQVMRNGR